jgi:hypothetical protein
LCCRQARANGADSISVVSKNAEHHREPTSPGASLPGLRLKQLCANEADSSRSCIRARSAQLEPDCDRFGEGPDPLVDLMQIDHEVVMFTEDIFEDSRQLLIYVLSSFAKSYAAL